MGENQSRPEALAARTVKGSVYSIGASAVTMVLGFGRSVLMARLLAPEDFGIVAFALTFLHFTTPLRDFGLDQALIHRKPDEETTLDELLAVHFSLRIMLIVVFVLFLVGAIPMLRRFYPQKAMLIPVLLVLTLGEVSSALGSTSFAYLLKEMHFKELALLQVLTSLSMTIVGPTMAWSGYGFWAIVGERISGLVVATVAVWTFIRPWRPQWKLDRAMAKWYLGYGKYVLLSGILAPVTNQFDDYWVGVELGSTPLGFYSKAYELAQYPRRVISDPIVNVLFSTFAKASSDRVRLSKAYFRASSLVIRVGFLVSGSLVLAADQLIDLLFGRTWLPMVSTFQLMIVYALLAPLYSISAHLVQAVGKPAFWTRARVAQVAYFVPAVIIGSRWLGVNGVAGATDLMMLIGLVVLLLQIRGLVDVGMSRLFALPTMALAAGVVTSTGVSFGLHTAGNMASAIVKVSTFAVVYSSTLLLFEREEYVTQLRTFANLLFRGRGHVGR